MPDREKVIAGINKILSETDEYDGVLWNVLALLKEHEAIKPSTRNKANVYGFVWTCGACGKDLHPNNIKAKYCRRCGQAVKFE